MNNMDTYHFIHYCILITNILHSYMIYKMYKNLNDFYKISLIILLENQEIIEENNSRQ